MDNIWLWLTIICLGFFAMISAVSFSDVGKAEQKHKYEIECLKSDGKIEFIMGNGATCIHK